MPLIISSLLTIVINTILGVFVFVRNPERNENRSFALFTAAIVGWITTLLLYYTINDQSFVLFVGRLNFTIAVFVAYFFYRFVYFFPREDIKINKVFQYAISLSAIIVAILSLFTGLVDKNEIVKGSERFVEYGDLYFLFAIDFILNFIFGVSLLAVKLKKASGVVRTQLQYLLLGCFLAFLVAIITNLILPAVFSIYALQPIGSLSTVLFVGFSAYVIVRHKLMDIKILTIRAASYTLLVLVLGTAFTFVVFFSVTFLFKEEVSTTVFFTFLFLSFAIALSFQSILKIFEKLTNRIFFKNSYNTEELIKELTHTMASEINIDILSQRILESLQKNINITSAAFILVKDHQVKNVKSFGFDSVDFTTAKELIDLPQIITDDTENMEFKNYLRNLNIAAVFPLQVKDEEIGLFVIGHKSSGEGLSSQDKEFLQIFAPEVAVALENAESYKEIQEFSRTLEKKVDERTEELKESQARELAKAKELLKLKDEFVFIASHDLKTPVAAIDGFIKLIEDSHEKFSKDTKDSFGAIIQASNRLKQLVNDILQVARSDSGTIKVELKPVNIVDIFKKSLKEVEETASQRKIKITTKFAKDAMVQADEAKLSEVIENLLSNAIKYNKEGGLVEVLTMKEGKNIISKVSDTGVGIPKDQEDKVFAKFFRAQQKGTEEVSGTGLGLFVVKMLVEKMNGTISFISQEGKGTTFIFTLPEA